LPEPSEDRRALYLRWRPLSFADVVGQEHVVRTLRNAIAAGSPAHAYLFCGPRGTGKTSLARILFRAVNCLDSRQGEPCGSCEVCLSALAGRALDLVEIDAASNRGIDDIRELREKVAFAPSGVRYRVYIIDEAHELTAPAWDAFLKTLEEPPPHAIFALATTEAHKVPSTIVSRCQRFDLRRIQPEAISQRLGEIAAQEGVSLEPAAAERLARMARGGLRDAISLLDQAASFTAGQVDLEALQEVLGLVDRHLVQQLLEQIARGQAAAALQLALAVAEDGADLRLFAEELTGQLRGLLFSSVGGGAVLRGEFSDEERDWLAREAAAWDLGALRTLLRALSDGLTRIRDGAQFQLHLELALLDACGAVGLVTAPPPAPVRAEPARPVRPVPLPPERASSEPPLVVASPPRAPAPDPAPPPALTAVPAPRAAAAPAAPLVSVEPPPGPAEFGDWSFEGEPDWVEPAAVLAGPASAPPPDLVAVGGSDEGLTAVGAPGEGLTALREVWPRIIEWVGHRSLFVASYLRAAEPRQLQDGNLVLTFEFPLHHERVAEARNRDLVEQGCAQIFGQRLRVKCEYSQPEPPGDDSPLDLDDPLLKLALERFGGRPEWLDV
jgi:DNA polymerase III subunit gamma/tau